MGRRLTRAGARLRQLAFWALALGVLAGPDAARARWYRAETDKFVVYGEGREQAVRDLAGKLSIYDSLLRRAYPSTRGRKPATKVQVVLAPQATDLQRVRPGLSKDILGFYTATSRGVFAVAVNTEKFGGDDILFHEYAHHFLLENFPIAFPAWFVEGWAEYFSTAEISAEAVRIGGYNEARLREVFGGVWMPLGEVLSKTTGETSPNKRNAYYAESWLLVHYMRSDPKRAEQLDEAIEAISKGGDPVASFEHATGLTMAQMTTALSRYRKLWVYKIPRDPNAPPPVVTVTSLPPSADDLMVDNLRLLLSPAGQVDGEFLAGVRQKAARFPGDAFAESTLARAEYMMGDVAAGEAISQRRLATDGADAEELLLAGMGQLFAGQRQPASRLARYRRGRPFLAKAYEANDHDHRAIYGYALARSLEPSFPTDSDVTALLLAHDLAPAVKETTLRSGMALLQVGRRAEAVAMLAPLLNDPHDSRTAARVRSMLDGKAPAANVDDAEDGMPPTPNK